MQNIQLLDSKRIEVFAASIRRSLADLRRLKMVNISGRVGQTRNPAFDAMLTTIIAMRDQLEWQISRADLSGEVPQVEKQFFQTARGVLHDSIELIDILRWLGAELPNDAISGETGADRGQIGAQIAGPSGPPPG